MSPKSIRPAFVTVRKNVRATSVGCERNQLSFERNETGKCRVCLRLFYGVPGMVISFSSVISMVMLFSKVVRWFSLGRTHKCAFSPLLRLKNALSEGPSPPLVWLRSFSSVLGMVTPPFPSPICGHTLVLYSFYAPCNFLHSIKLVVTYQ